MKFGDRLKQLRGKMSQEELARRMKLKRQANISALEKRDTPPRPETIIRLARALNREPIDLLDGVDTSYDGLTATNGAAEKPPKGRARTPLEPPAAKRSRAGSG